MASGKKRHPSRHKRKGATGKQVTIENLEHAVARAEHEHGPGPVRIRREVPQNVPSVIITDDPGNIPADADLIIEDTDPGGPGPLRITQRGRQPALEPAVLSPRPGELLDLHADLARRHAYPDPGLLRYYDKRIAQTTPGRTAASGRELAAIFARMLAQARTYQVTADMAQTVTAACRGGSPDFRVQPGMLPWPAGFAWLDWPLEYTAPDGQQGSYRAVSWGPGESSSALIAAWNPDETGRLVAVQSAPAPYGAIITDSRDITLPGRIGMIRFARTLWHFLSAEIAVSSPAPDVDRHARRRALRSLRHGEVHVVTLRRRKPLAPETDGHRVVHWSCRWPVNGFWRHVRRSPDHPLHHAVPDAAREHCTGCGMKVRFVPAFLKGPPGLPLKSERQLYKLKR